MPELVAAKFRRKAARPGKIPATAIATGIKSKAIEFEATGQAALAAGFMAVAASSNAVEISRMLMTPIRL
jgi:hypothetical protein